MEILSFDRAVAFEVMTLGECGVDLGGSVDCESVGVLGHFSMVIVG